MYDRGRMEAPNAVQLEQAHFKRTNKHRHMTPDTQQHAINVVNTQNTNLVESVAVPCLSNELHVAQQWVLTDGRHKGRVRHGGACRDTCVGLVCDNEDQRGGGDRWEHKTCE